MSNSKDDERARILAPDPRAPLDSLDRPPTFSIVIPAYQAADTIGDAVGSALDQVHPAHEVIVVDDGSTDDLDRALRPFSGRITLISKENGGPASARNAGSAVARGEFIAVLDADDAYHPRRLAALAELACARPDLDLITTDTRFVVEGRPVGSFRDHNPFVVEDQREAILHSCFIGGWAAVRLSRLQAIGGFDESLFTSHDWDCWLRLLLDGSPAGLIADPYYDYVLHPGTVTASRVFSLWDRARLLEKAARNPALRPAERPALERSWRRHRTRAVRAETEAALFGSGPRDRLREFVRSGDIGVRTRGLAALALVAPALARRVVTPDRAPVERFTTPEP